MTETLELEPGKIAQQEAIGLAMRETKINLWDKLSAITAEVGRVPKNGFNEFHRYKFATESDVVEAVSKACHDHRVHISSRQKPGSVKVEPAPADKDGKVKGVRATVTVIVRLRNVDAPDEVEEYEFEDHADDTGDKAIKKASTGAKKYALLLGFNVATGDDPDADNGKRQQPSAPAPIDTATTGIICALGTKLDFSRERWEKACRFISSNRTGAVDELTAPEGGKLLKYLRKIEAEMNSKAPADQETGEVVYCTDCGAQRAPKANVEPHTGECKLKDVGERV
jgi:hypothetical protein